VLDQLSFDYNKSHSTGAKLYSWDAVNPTSGAVGDPIVTKSGCTSVPRPNGSSAGILALIANAKTSDGKHFCIDFARSSRPRNSTDPAKGAGGIVFDAVEVSAWSAARSPAGSSNGCASPGPWPSHRTCC